MVTRETQSILISMIQYFHNGDLNTFKKIVHLTSESLGSISNIDVSNLFHACHISGLVESSETDFSNRWWATPETSLLINGLVPKQLYATNIKGEEKLIKPVIIDTDGQPLLLCSFVPNSQNESVFSSNFSELCPNFIDVEKDICSEEEFKFDFKGNIEIYDIKLKKWILLDINREESVSNLIRVKREFSGFNYFILIAKLKLLFRVNYPEWAFVAAYYLLNWNIDEVVERTNNSVKFPRTFRIPTLLSRYLFSAAELVVLGRYVEYKGLPEVSLTTLIKFFNKDA